MQNSFKHIQSAHCENGVTTSLLNYYGCDFMNEPLAFGLGSGLFYIHIPFVKMNNGPGISFRTMPGAIFKRTCKSLHINIIKKKFKDREEAQQFLDQKISENIPVGCQVGVFNLPYFPDKYRFHFNAHNIIVYGKENGRYLVSDPIMEDVTSLSAEELERVRFAQGWFAPKGHIYYPENAGEKDMNMLRKGIVKGIKRNVRDMLRIPGHIAGVSGIVYTSKQIRKWRDKLGGRKAGLYLGQIVRMQEEIGTGGGGFRFIYAAFIEQASEYLSDDKLLKISDDFTKAGDLWRNSAAQMAGIYKNRLTEQKDFNVVADMLLEISETEKAAFNKLSKLKFNI
ncbi:BtrH N-terminal domain-containing protein [candidate division KSB1 bacterium]